ncbi:MAG: glucosaminidase domain-containing protein [Desulfobulbaceae bacterium]|nr:glucosaminidase domain-containing protein [Desulfobulbaceae bacterium]HIJ79291.1 glucosaminidase [Deltaproteobacteria bacterium]
MNASLDEDKPVVFGRYPADPDMVHLVVGVTLVLFFLMVVYLKPPVEDLFDFSRRTQSYPLVEVDSRHDLVSKLQSNDLWDVGAYSEIKPLLISRLPCDFSDLDIITQKKAFIHTLLPVALVALAEIEDERAALQLIMQKISVPVKRFLFDGEELHWQKGLTRNEIYFLKTICQKYRTAKVAELLKRVNVVPVSLVLAQGALESSWGGSRFALEGNNLFGIWTWGEKGITPADREVGKVHKVAIYESLLESVRAYILMLNRVSAYSYLRQLRVDSMDSLELVNGLLYYSERRGDYIADIASVINSNQLQIYDHCILASTHLAMKGFGQIRISSLN